MTRAGRCHPQPPKVMAMATSGRQHDKADLPGPSEMASECGVGEEQRDQGDAVRDL